MFAHRGARAYAPENTLANFRACLELGMGFEFDVQRAKDGELVCIHDDTLDITTNGKGRVADFPLAAIRELDAGGWFDGEIGDGHDPKSVSHEHTFMVDTADASALDAMLVKLSEKVARRLRDHGVWARTVQIKLRYSDFATFTRSKTLDHATQIDSELADAARALFHKAWTRKPIRLLGVYAQQLEDNEGQTSLLAEPRTENWRKALAAVDKVRAKYGDDGIVSLAAALAPNPAVVAQFVEAARHPAEGATPLSAWAVPVPAYWLRARLDGRRAELTASLCPGQTFDDVERWVKVFESPDRAEWQKPDELAHYARACVDILFKFPFSKKDAQGNYVGEELEGIAARSDSTFSAHM